MSSTQMDFSPIVIDRKQDIASWLEGDIDQLAVRDKNRYQKRKSAIIEYFQSDSPAEEISANHRLAKTDKLEEMARRCCTLHGDGQQWGFRALVPGVTVVTASNQTAPATVPTPTETTQTEETSARARLFALDEDAVTQVQVISDEMVANEDDTSKHEAVVSTKFIDLPQTPLPIDLEEKIESISSQISLNLSDKSANTLEITETTLAESEIIQEDFPSVTSDLTVEELALQQEFSLTPTSLLDAPVEFTESEITQEDFPAASTSLLDAPVESTESEIIQEDFPSVIQAPTIVEPVAQEDFPAASTSLLDTPFEPATPEITQEDFPSVISDLTAEELALQQEFSLVPTSLLDIPVEPDVTQEDFPSVANETIEVMAGQTIVQEDFPTTSDVLLTTVADAEITQEDFPTLVQTSQVSEEHLVIEDDDEDNGEPTGKQHAVKLAASGTQNLPQVPQVPEQENSPTAKSDEQTAKALHKEIVVTDEMREIAADTTQETQVAELDTVEVARIEVEDRLNRVASTRTIKVPVALLDALEKADQALQDKTEAATTTDEKAAKDLPLSVAPAIAQPEPTDVIPVAEKAQTIDDIAATPTRTLETWRRDNRQLTQTPVLKPPTQSLAEDSRYRITGKQAAIKHAVRRRWGKIGRQQKYRRWTRIISAAIIVSILVILLIPLGVGLVGYNAYTNIKNVADDGVSNLLSLKDLIPANKNDITSALNTQKLANAKGNLQKAQSDFLQLQDMVNRPDIESLLQQFAPQYSNKLDMARRLVQVALDVSRMGQELIGVAQMGATVLHGSGSLISSSSTKPLFSADDINAVEAALVHAQYYISDIQTQMSQVNLASLPLGSASQKAQLAKYLNQIPQAQSTIAQVQTLVGPVSWLLGVGQTRHILVQTLDRGELRPSGGFEGQYGLLTMQNGRMSPFSLRDITLLDYAENGAELGATPPPQYSWMNFGNFGVRDANLSADFPTTAQIVMHYFQSEGGGPVDGDIQITPVVIEQFLQLTGPIKIAEYNETITAQNLENKLHEYQQDPRLINKQQQITGQDTKATRKAFTNLVGTMLMTRIKKLSPTEMISFGKILLKDLKSRDLQIYLNNPVAEQWLTQNGDSGAMPQFTKGNDGFMVVQSNISISKAAQYVKSTYTDNVTLDANGGATHNLTITLNYQQTGPVYGFNTYADYMRIYAPANAQLQSAYGFNTGSVLCTPGKPTVTTTGKGGKTTTSGGGGAYTDDGIGISGCGQYYHTFTDTNARYCPDGNYELGYDGMMAKAWPVQNLGSPSLTHSDLPGYAMWGGLTLTPMNCISKITLSWYVPHVVQNTAGQAPYQMIVGHQAGWPDNAQISINASALKGVKSLSYNQTIDVDTLVALAPRPLPPSQQKPTTPTPAVTPSATPKKP